MLPIRSTLYVLLFLPITFFSADCGSREDDNMGGVGQIDLNFKGVFGNNLLVMLANHYDYEDGMQLRFQLFQFYLSDINLIAEDGSKVNLGDIVLVNFETLQSESAAEKGFDFSFENIPAGRYIGLEMGVGVAPALNSKAPADYALGHPLSISSNYWTGLSSYIFTKIEGNADLNKDGAFTEKLSFHIGEKEGAPMYETIEFGYQFSLERDQTFRLPFLVDLKQVISPGPDNFLDFRVVTQDHTNQESVYSFIIENLKKNAFILNL